MPRKPPSLHSPEVKERALLKARGRGARSLASVADELNMSFGTLRNLTKAARTPGPQAQTTHPALGARRPPDRLHSALAPCMKAIRGGEALARWCREHGLFAAPSAPVARQLLRCAVCPLCERRRARFANCNASTTSSSANSGARKTHWSN